MLGQSQPLLAVRDLWPAVQVRLVRRPVHHSFVVRRPEHLDHERHVLPGTQRRGLATALLATCYFTEAYARAAYRLWKTEQLLRSDHCATEGIVARSACRTLCHPCYVDTRTSEWSLTWRLRRMLQAVTWPWFEILSRRPLYRKNAFRFCNRCLWEFALSAVTAKKQCQKWSFFSLSHRPVVPWRGVPLWLSAAPTWEQRQKISKKYLLQGNVVILWEVNILSRSGQWCWCQLRFYFTFPWQLAHDNSEWFFAGLSALLIQRLPSSPDTCRWRFET